jgi:hypothetical protein
VHRVLSSALVLVRSFVRTAFTKSLQLRAGLLLRLLLACLLSFVPLFVVICPAGLRPCVRWLPFLQLFVALFPPRCVSFQVSAMQAELELRSSEVRQRRRDLHHARVAATRAAAAVAAEWATRADGAAAGAAAELEQQRLFGAQLAGDGRRLTEQRDALTAQVRSAGGRWFVGDNSSSIGLPACWRVVYWARRGQRRGCASSRPP